MAIGDKFTQKRSQELTLDHMEDLIEISIDPEVSLKQLMLLIKEGKTVQFIVGEDFKIILSSRSHVDIKNISGMWNNLIQNGSFIFGYPKGIISFMSSFSVAPEIDPRVKKIQPAVENKIKSFLKSKGIEVK